MLTPLQNFQLTLCCISCQKTSSVETIKTAHERANVHWASAYISITMHFERCAHWCLEPVYGPPSCSWWGLMRGRGVSFLMVIGGVYECLPHKWYISYSPTGTKMLVVHTYWLRRLMIHSILLIIIMMNKMSLHCKSMYTHNASH